MLELDTGWLELIHNNDKRMILISNLVESKCLARYPRPMAILFDHVLRFIVHELTRSPVE